MENYLKKELYNKIKEDSTIFDFIQECSLDGIWYWDLEKPENEWMNDKFWTELGYNPKEMAHSPTTWQGIINPDDLDQAIYSFNQHLENPKIPYDQIVRYTHKDNSTVYIRCRGLAILDKTGKPVRMLGAHNNITPAMASVKKLEQLNEEIIDKNKELEQFSYITSHNLQEPLNSILSFSYLLKEEYKEKLGNDGLKYLDIIEESSSRMKDYILTILEYSQIGQNKTKEVFKAKEVIRTLKKEVKNSHSTEKITINSKIKFDLYAYKNDFYKLLKYLLSNAIKYKSPNRPLIIDIKGEEVSNKYLFSITDNGIGIEEEFYSKIFEIFQRLHTYDEYKGTGIGLANCKKIVDLHQGKIWVDSEVGVGTTFYFTLKK